VSDLRPPLLLSHLAIFTMSLTTSNRTQY